MKTYVLTSNEIGKIGTKHASLSCEPQKFLANFAESEQLTEVTIQKAEEYLAHVWFGARLKPKSRTFDQLCMECHTHAITPKSLEALPPTSSVIRGHIQIAFFVVHNVLCLIDEPTSTPDPTNYD